MIIWLIVIVSIVAAMTILVLLRKSKVDMIERFQNASGSTWDEYNATQGTGTVSPNSVAGIPTPPSSFASFLNSIGGISGAENSVPATLRTASTNYVDSQANYGQNVLNKEVMTNKNMPNYASVMNPSVNQPDVYLGTPETIVVKNLQPDNESQFTDADMQWCRKASMPLDMPPHIKGATVGCGWYYIPDLRIASSGALGQAKGPIFSDTIPNIGNGQWIWDLAYAQQLEEIKNCKRVTACESIEVPSVRGVCGFCYEKGHAMPAHSDGTEKYPDNPDALCNGKLVMTAAQCRQPEPLPLVTPSGFNCGTLGYPSADYSLRLYKSTECTDELNGKWDQVSGMCTAIDGSLISKTCADLNSAAPAVVANICTPDNNGGLSAACLISLAKGLGYTAQGAIIKMLQSGGSPTQMDSLAMDILKGQNVVVNPILYTGGVILAADASNAYDDIFNMTKTGSLPIVKEAAKWLTIGTSNFDPCDLPDMTPGPFFPQCVQQAWRVAGCQPAGSEYPSQQTSLDQLNLMDWGSVKSQFQKLYNSMSGGDPVQQDINVKRCLGITTQRAIPKPCIDVTQVGLVLNLDREYFAKDANQSAFKRTGVWPSTGSFTGNFTINGTKSCDGRGAFFDGTSVAGGPNLITNLIAPPEMPAPPEPTAMTGPWIAGGGKIPILKITADDQGNKVYIAFESPFTKMINYNNVAKYYTGPISNYSPSEWSTYISAGTNYVLDPKPGVIPKSFDPIEPIMTAYAAMGDCGFPPGATGIGGDGKTYFSIAFNAGANPIQSSNGTMETLINEVNAVLANKTATSQAIEVTIKTDNGLSWTGPVTAMGNGGWVYFISGTGPSPINPAGTYYFPYDLGRGAGNNSEQFAGWDSVGGINATMTLSVKFSVSETREFWINPSVDTCEILAIFTGPSFSQTYTALGIYKGQLVCALQSVEKGYTFFNCGPIVVNQWSHIVHVYANGVNSIYINGIGPVSMKLTRSSPGKYMGYSLGGGSQMNPFYQNRPAPVPFQGQIGAFRVYNRALLASEVQSNLAATLPIFVNQVEIATKNDPNSLAMAAGKFYVPMLGNAINFSA